MAVTGTRRYKVWGWGYEDQQPAREQLREAAAGFRTHLGFEPGDVEEPVSVDRVELPPPRLEAPASLAEICSTSTYDRASHTYGKAYRDIVRAFRGQFDNPPDVVARPRDEDEVAALLDWCASARAAAIPFGGGTSVVGGVEARVGDSYAGAVSIDLRELDQVLDIDPVSRAARIQAGASGPRLEEQLKPHGLTMRFYPGSFEQSTLGGWIATRAGGHYATVYPHIDDLVESVRAVTPRGIWESRRLPGSGAGPSPDRALIGSEGILGAITEAWVRLQIRPRWKASAGVRFARTADGIAAVRALSQSGLYPANCRLLDPGEAAVSGAAGGDVALLVLGFESADHPLEAWMERGLELCRDHGGQADEPRYSERDPDAAGGEDQGGVGAWRSAFVHGPYLRDTMLCAGIVVDTFETAMTWDRMDEYIATVSERAEAAVREECGAGVVTWRFTHAYPDGAAPYFTVLAPARRGSEIEQWDAIKTAASEAVESAGGTITHHHAVGRDHRPWYDRQRPEPFARALRAAKAELDPQGVLNPGVLVDP
jgi:alkyldihydroxyacetonephosphate synthase